MHSILRIVTMLGLGIALALAATGYAVAVPAKKGSTTVGTVKIENSIKRFEKRQHKYEGALRFWYSKERRWMLHLNQQDKPCWKLKLSGPLKLCMAARSSVRTSAAKLQKVQASIEYLESLLLDTGNEDHWNCIYRYERDPGQGWATRTGNGYYGGLQMDISFQRAHGLDLLLQKGTANNWTDREQMMVAERARQGVRTSLGENGRVYTWQDEARGYNPWPNTARTCGLL